MELSKETMDNIQKFAKEQANKNLSNAELSVFERVAKKGDIAKSKVMKNISKLKVTSDQVKDATNDLTLYMNDYVADLMRRRLYRGTSIKNGKRKFIHEGRKWLQYRYTG